MSFVFSIMIVSFFIASVISSNWAEEDKAGGYLRKYAVIRSVLAQKSMKTHLLNKIPLYFKYKYYLILISFLPFFN